MAAVIPAAPGRRPSPVKDGGGVRLGVLRAGDFIKQVTKHGSTSGCVSGTRNPTGPLHLNTSPMLPLAEAPCQWPSRRSAAGGNSPLQHLRNTSPPQYLPYADCVTALSMEARACLSFSTYATNPHRTEATTHAIMKGSVWRFTHCEGQCRRPKGSYRAKSWIPHPALSTGDHVLATATGPRVAVGQAATSHPSFHIPHFILTSSSTHPATCHRPAPASRGTQSCPSPPAWRAAPA